MKKKKKQRSTVIVLDNNLYNLARGTYHGTWTKEWVRVSKIIEINIGIQPRGINVPVVIDVDEENRIEIYVEE